MQAIEDINGSGGEILISPKLADSMLLVAKDSRNWPVLVFGPIIFPVLIPLGNGLLLWRLLQWYLIARREPQLTTADVSQFVLAAPTAEINSSELVCSFRAAKSRLWFGSLFWPVAIALLVLALGIADRG